MRLLYISALLLLLVLVNAQQCVIEECVANEDCVPAQCCHPTGCVVKENAPDCTNISCTMDCQPGTMDCGQGHCECINRRCKAVYE